MIEFTLPDRNPWPLPELALRLCDLLHGRQAACVSDHQRHCPISDGVHGPKAQLSRANNAWLHQLPDHRYRLHFRYPPTTDQLATLGDMLAWTIKAEVQ